PIVLAPLAHPFAIVPFVVERPRARRGQRRRLRRERERIRLVDFVSTLGADDAEFVRAAVRNARDECFPNAGAFSARLKCVYADVPLIEVTDDGDTRGVRRPNAEPRAVGSEMAPHRVVEPAMRSFAEQIDVMVGEWRNFP